MTDAAEDEARKEQLRRENAEMAAQLEQLKVQIAEADGEIEELKRQQGGGRSSDSERGSDDNGPTEPEGWSGDNSRGLDGARGIRFIATKKLAVRSGVEANTRKVGTIAPGELVIGLEQRVSSEGAVRVRSAKGWASATSSKGTPLLRPAIEGEGTPGSPPVSTESGSAPAPDSLAAPLRLPSKADLIELSGLQRPPSAVRIMLNTLRVVLEGKDSTRYRGKGSWAATSAILKNQSVALMRMSAVDPSSLGPGVARQLALLINHPDFHPDAIARQSKAAASVAKWLVAVYSSMRHPTATEDVDAESSGVDASPALTKSQRPRAKGPRSHSSTKKVFERLSATPTAMSRPVSARPASASHAKRQNGAVRRPQSAPRARSRSAVAKTTPSQNIRPITRSKHGPSGGADGGGVRWRTSGAKSLHADGEVYEMNRTLHTSVHMADLMRGVPDQHIFVPGCGEDTSHRVDDSSTAGRLQPPAHEKSSASDGRGSNDIETAMRVSDFLPRHAPPAAGSAGLRQWYDIEIGSVQLQAQKLRDQLSMAEHAIALLVAARDRETSC